LDCPGEKEGGGGAGWKLGKIVGFRPGEGFRGPPPGNGGFWALLGKTTGKKKTRGGGEPNRFGIKFRGLPGLFCGPLEGADFFHPPKFPKGGGRGLCPRRGPGKTGGGNCRGFPKTRFRGTALAGGGGGRTGGPQKGAPGPFGGRAGGRNQGPGKKGKTRVSHGKTILSAGAARGFGFRRRQGGKMGQKTKPPGGKGARKKRRGVVAPPTPFRVKLGGGDQGGGRGGKGRNRK